MKELQNNFTTREQSKRLLELGVPVDSADCYYIDSMTSFQDKSPHIITLDYKYSDGIHNGYESRFCPCWSVGRLIEIFLLCTPYKDIALNTSDLVEQMVISLFMVNKDGLLDFSKLED